jgi:hypothetical protein
LAFPAPEVETACEMFALAHLHGAELLKTRASLFIKNNFDAVKKTPEWKQLLQNQKVTEALFVTIVSM